MGSVNSSPGRPRNPEIDKRVIAAARELLAEEGYAATTILAVSRKSDVRPASIYRRWASRIELIEEAIFPGLDNVAVEPTGDLKGDLERFVDAYKASFSSPVAIAALPGLIAEYHTLPPQERTSRRAWRSARPEFCALLNAAPAELVASTLNPDDVFDLMVGAILYKVYSTSFGLRVDAPDRTVELILRTLRA